MRLGLVSTYPPRACGIGTFSYDLRAALLAHGAAERVDVVAIVGDQGDGDAPEVAIRIRQGQRGDYAAAALALDRRAVDVVMIEHEYGIFGGSDGAHVLSLAQELRQPLVVTLHTVVDSPSVHQAQTLQALCELATLVCVFTETAERMVVQTGIATAGRVRVVPHGAPVELLPSRRGGRRLVRLPSSPSDGGRRAAGPARLATFGLISPGKGIETAIRAMPAILGRHPDTVYVVAGQTHPEVVRHHGEEYRLSLQRLARDLGVDDQVIFDDRFLGIEDLASMLRATTIYLTPYRSRDQIVSGALTFAIAAGCPTVSTPYHYAEDLLAAGAGILVPFEDPPAIAEAVNGLLDDPHRLGTMRHEARRLGRGLGWPSVGRQTARVLREAVAIGRLAGVRHVPPTTLPRPRTSHLMTLIDDVGIIQHAEGIVPKRRTGYCTDDVARLVVVTVALGTTMDPEVHTRTLALGIGFLRHAWSPAAQGMHNFLSYERRWLDEPHAGDHLGRAAWALGEVVAAHEQHGLGEPARRLLCELLPVLAEQRSPRTMAFAMLGLARADPAVLDEQASSVLRDLADRLADLQAANASPEWYWAEDSLMYDNARLPQALIASGMRLGDERLISEGLRALDWYAGELDVDGPHIRLVGHHGRRRGEPRPGAGDEQPLDAAALVEAQVEAYLATEDGRHAQRAVHAFEWFLGRNRLEHPVYDFETGGCHDGLGDQAVNDNQGAESTLAYLQALLVLDAAGLQTTSPR